jgi:hypothetical protein
MLNRLHPPSIHSMDHLPIANRIRYGMMYPGRPKLAAFGFIYVGATESELRFFWEIIQYEVKIEALGLDE